MAGTLTSCVEDTDYETPQISCDEPMLTGEETTMENILNQWIAANDGDGNNVVDFYDTEEPIEFNTDNPNYIVGYVVSSDKTGNFYKELYLQNDPTTPTASIKLGVDVGSLFTKYDVGRKVYVYLHDLALNRSHGEMVLGEMINNQLDDIRENRAKENIFRNCQAVPVTPILKENILDITEADLGKLIKLDNVQFLGSLLGEVYVNPYDSYDSHRTLISCNDFATIRVETSTFANFRDDILPSGKGSVTGVLARNYEDSFFVIRVSGTESFSFNNERCSLNCDNPDPIGGANIVFEEDFESYSNSATNLGSWSNINVNGGDNLFEIRSYNGEKYIQCSAYDSDEDPLDVWMITPTINLDSSTDEELTFETKTGYNNGSALLVLVSTDYTGDISTANWELVDSELADGPSSGYQAEFVSSGSVDVSCVDGDVHFAFRYLGADTYGGITTTFQIDNVKVTGN